VQRLRDDLAEVGVGLKVRAMSPERYLATWTGSHEFDLIALGYNLYPGFTDFDLYGSSWDIRDNPQGWNPGGYHNAEVDRAIREILGATDSAAQREALLRLQRVANEDLFGLWFGFPLDLILVRPELRGFQPNILWQTWDTRKLWRQPATG
jgi:ABC-type transport system substrate-binding protein